MITENDCNNDDDETASKYEETLSNLALETQSYSSTEVLPEAQVLADTEIETNVADSDITLETRIVSETQKETRNAPAKKIVAKPHEKRTVARSQLQAMSQLASGVNRLVEVNAKQKSFKRVQKFKISKEFRKEEVGKNRQREKEMAQIYLRMMEM